MGKNTLKMQLSGFEELITKLDGLNGDVKEAVDDSLRDLSEVIASDTETALAVGNLPRGGKYSQGDTIKAIVPENDPKWSGTIATVDAGFDYDKPGAGGFLITGTPRMRPVRELNRMYKGKKYMKERSREMEQYVQDLIDEKMGG